MVCDPFIPSQLSPVSEDRTAFASPSPPSWEDPSFQISDPSSMFSHDPVCLPTHSYAQANGQFVNVPFTLFAPNDVAVFDTTPNTLSIEDLMKANVPQDPTYLGLDAMPLPEPVPPEFAQPYLPMPPVDLPVLEPALIDPYGNNINAFLQPPPAAAIQIAPAHFANPRPSSSQRRRLSDADANVSGHEVERPHRPHKIPPQKPPKGGRIMRCIHPDCHMLVFRKPSAYKQHELVHSGVKPWICEYCDKGLQNKSNLNRHYRHCKVKKARDSLKAALDSGSSVSPDAELDRKH